MARPRTESPAVRKLSIIKAARTLLIKNGFENLRMEDVADEARLAKGTLYLYFKNKEDLYVAIFIDLIENFDRCLMGISPTLSGQDRLTALINETLGFVDKNQDFIFHATSEVPNLNRTKAGRRLQEKYGEHTQLIAEFLKGFVKDGIVRTQDIHLGGLYLDALVRMFILEKMIAGTKESFLTKSKSLTRFFLHGIGSKGISS